MYGEELRNLYAKMDTPKLGRDELQRPPMMALMDES